MKIAMANDHAGTVLKNAIKAYLEAEGHEVQDFGTYDEESCDLSDFVYPAALAVAKGECDRGVFVDGVGYGSAMIANKVNGIYAVVCQDPFCTARPPAQRQQRPLPRRQDHRRRDRHGDRQDLDAHRALDGRKISAPHPESTGHQRQMLRTGEINGGTTEKAAPSETVRGCSFFVRGFQSACW